MFGLIKKIFIGLLTSLVNRSNHTNCVSLSNQKCMIQPTLNKGALSVVRQFLATENPLNMMKNAFYFNSKANLFPFSRYLSFYLDFLVMYPGGLIKKIRLISNFMTSQTG